MIEQQLLIFDLLLFITIQFVLSVGREIRRVAAGSFLQIPATRMLIIDFQDVLYDDSLFKL